MRTSLEIGQISFTLIGKKPDTSVGAIATVAVNDIILFIKKRAGENMVVWVIYFIYGTFLCR